jgi:3-hydroxyisobutyrate dehydrogenase
MGQPMALNLARAGVPLVVWNRSEEGLAPFRSLDVPIAATVGDVFRRTRTVILMLATEAAIDDVMRRGTAEFIALVRDHTVVNMGSTAPEYSLALHADVVAAGGRFVEAPVSGSRRPAEMATLVAMVAGAPADVETVRPLLAPMCRATVSCGSVPAGVLMKLSINTFMLTMLAGLAEAAHFAARHGIDLEQFVTVVDASPLASDASRVKGRKLASRDFSVQAFATDAFRNQELILEAARRASVATPMLTQCHALYAEMLAQGDGELDMIGVVRAIEARSATLKAASTDPLGN